MKHKHLVTITLILMGVLLFLGSLAVWYVVRQRRLLASGDVEEFPNGVVLGEGYDSLVVPPTIPGVSPRSEEAEPPASEEAADSTQGMDSQSTTEAVRISAGSELERYITATHKVQKGDSFSLVSGFYWQDSYLWPDLYTQNADAMRTNDPDLIYPDEVITIYNRLGEGNNFSVEEREQVLQAYLEVYRAYKRLGTRKNNSVWALLWSAAKYDKNFLDNYANQLEPEDIRVAKQYIAEKGYLD